jgi:hypothetical protein
MKCIYPLLLLSICLTCIFVLPGCKQEKDTLTIDYKYDYLPLDTGHYVIYDVDSIHYSYTGVEQRDTVSYQLMELVADTFYDNQNRLNYRLEIYRRSTPVEPWVINRVWYAFKDVTNVQKVEDDIRFIKMVFPPEDGKIWNGNQYAPQTGAFEYLANWEYSYSDLDQPKTIGNLNFDSTVVVNEWDDENGVQKNFSREIYAKGVGLVYRQFEMLSSPVINSDWEAGNMNGFRIRMTVNSYQ